MNSHRSSVLHPARKMVIYLKIAHRARWLGEWVGDLCVWEKSRWRRRASAAIKVAAF